MELLIVDHRFEIFSGSAFPTRMRAGKTRSTMGRSCEGLQGRFASRCSTSSRRQRWRRLLEPSDMRAKVLRSVVTQRRALTSSAETTASLLRAANRLEGRSPPTDPPPETETGGDPPPAVSADGSARTLFRVAVVLCTDIRRLLGLPGEAAGSGLG